MPGHNVIVIGGSAGGGETLINLVQGLPADLPAAVFVVLHFPPPRPAFCPRFSIGAGRFRPTTRCMESRYCPDRSTLRRRIIT